MEAPEINNKSRCKASEKRKENLIKFALKKNH
jgi:hypothetical protein